MNNNSKHPVNQIFADLEQYLDFCRDYGYRYDERDLYNMRSYPYQQYTKFMARKPAKNMWAEDARKFEQALG